MSKDTIYRQAAIDAADEIIARDESGNNDVVKAMTAWKEYIKDLPSAQPEEDILAWLLAYHTKSFELQGRYLPHEVIGWVVHDFANAYMAERREE